MACRAGFPAAAGSGSCTPARGQAVITRPATAGPRHCRPA